MQGLTRVYQVLHADDADDCLTQGTMDGLEQAPLRWLAVGIGEVLRGKIPGLPGLRRRTGQQG